MGNCNNCGTPTSKPSPDNCSFCEYPVNPTELKSWIVKHANFYRHERRKTSSSGAKEHFEGHMRAMRALWDTLKALQGITFTGLFKEMHSI